MTTGALTLSQVAEQLGTNRVSILRLIARQALAAAPVDGHDYRVSPKTLASYVEAGAPDFKTIDDSSPWFWGHPTNPAILLRQLLPDAVADPSNDALMNTKGGTIQSPVMTVNVGLSTEVREILSKTPRDVAKWDSIFKQRGTEAPVELNMLQLTVVDELFTAARSAVRSLSTRRQDGKAETRSLLEQFYASPKSYSEAIAAASAKVAEFVIRWNKLLVIKRGPDEKPMPNVTVMFNLPIVDAAGSRSAFDGLARSMVQHAF